MLIDRFLTSHKALLEIRSRTEYPPMSRHYNTLDTIVDIKHAKRLLHLAHESSCEGIVLSWPVQCQDNDRRRGGSGLGIVRCADLFPRERVVGGGKRNWGVRFRHRGGWGLLVSKSGLGEGLRIQDGE